MASSVQADEMLHEKIKRKFKIKNTTGYSLNALVDYSDGFDILKHLMIGSEGTLAFISDITYHTVIDHQNKALALAIYPTIERACKAVQLLKNQPVSAVELMDRAAIRSVDSAKGVPEFLKTLSKDAAVLLIETRAEIQFYVMQEMAALYPELKFFGESTASRFNMFDKVTGSDQIRLKFSVGMKTADILPYWRKDEEAFKEKSKPYYLYH